MRDVWQLLRERLTTSEGSGCSFFSRVDGQVSKSSPSLELHAKVGGSAVQEGLADGPAQS